jgi:hypothetical protein
MPTLPEGVPVGPRWAWHGRIGEPLYIDPENQLPGIQAPRCALGRAGRALVCPLPLAELLAAAVDALVEPAVPIYRDFLPAVAADVRGLGDALQHGQQPVYPHRRSPRSSSRSRMRPGRGRCSLQCADVECAGARAAGAAALRPARCARCIDRVGCAAGNATRRCARTAVKGPAARDGAHSSTAARACSSTAGQAGKN